MFLRVIANFPNRAEAGESASQSLIRTSDQRTMSVQRDNEPHERTRRMSVTFLFIISTLGELSALILMSVI